MDSLKICAVTVTYGDRFDLCSETVAKALRAGAHRVVVVDNGSVSSSAGDLARLAQASANVQIVTLSNNLGSAAGFSAGMRAALLGDCDLVWLLDDDNWVEDNTLQALLEKRVLLARELNDPHLVMAAFRTTNAHQIRLAEGQCASHVYPREGSFLSLDVAQRLLRWRSSRSSGFPGETERNQIPFGPYGGLLIPRTVIGQVGTPDPNLVLYEDDTAWTSKITRAGYRIQFCAAARIADAQSKWAVAGGGSGPAAAVRSGDAVRLYYAVRNRVLFDKQRAGSGRLRARYNINRAVFFAYIQLFTLGRRYRAQRNLFVRAVKDGEAGVLTNGPRLAWLDLPQTVAGQT